jgi:ribosomal protein S18 acetylase RimI-like enzyme
MATTSRAVQEIEEALVGHWSHFGRWPKGVLVEEEGTLRYETPIPYLPYNGVVRTMVDGDADAVLRRVRGSFARRGVACLWWDHPRARPADLGARLEVLGLHAVERVTGMALDLRPWTPPQLPEEVRYEEVRDARGLEAYADLIVSYWEVPDDVRPLVEEVNSYWLPERTPITRWVAWDGDLPIGKVLLSRAAPPGVAAIYGMSVRPEARGRGVAAGLTTVCLAHAKELGCERVVLHSSEMAVRVYERAGFRPVCELTAYADAALWASRHH